MGSATARSNSSWVSGISGLGDFDILEEQIKSNNVN
jgi:hypothetical protein